MRIYQIAICTLLALAVSPALSDDSLSDFLVDGIVDELKDELLQSGQSEVTLPELSGQVKKKVTFVTLKASFLGQGGWLNNLTTIHRSQPSKMESTDNTISLELTLELDDLNFGFQRFAIDLIGMKLHGHLDSHIKKNSVQVALTVTTDDDDNCTTDITTLKVTELEGVNVKISGHNKVADWIYNGITNTIEKVFKNTIKNALSNAVRQALTTVMKDHEICSLISL